MYALNLCGSDAEFHLFLHERNVCRFIYQMCGCNGTHGINNKINPVILEINKSSMSSVCYMSPISRPVVLASL